MSEELVIKKCEKCGALIKVLKDCSCDSCKIVCCGEGMNKLVPNSVEAAIEKHIPTYEIKGNMIEIKVNHVMEDNHYIEWISMLKDGKEATVYFKPGMEAIAHFEYIPGSVIYAYCNKHELWKKEVE